MKRLSEDNICLDKFIERANAKITTVIRDLVWRFQKGSVIYEVIIEKNRFKEHKGKRVSQAEDAACSCSPGAMKSCCVFSKKGSC